MTPAILGNFTASAASISSAVEDGVGAPAGAPPHPASPTVQAPLRMATVVWRVARGSMLEVALVSPERDSPPGNCLNGASVVIRTNAVGLLPTMPGEATAALEPDAGSGEIAFRIDLGEASGVASLRLVTMAGGRPPVVVTDLPERLGLRGGTYVVERVEA